VLVWLNGRCLHVRDARLSVLDRGLLHGDGLYDTWRTYDGEPFAVAAHLRRLAAAARQLRLPSPGPAAPWTRRARRLVARNGLRDATIRLTITRGGAGDSLVPDRPAPPTQLLTVRRLPPDLAEQQAQGIAAVLLPFPRDVAPPWGGLKLLGHPSAVVGRMLAVRRRAREGLYVTADDEVTEGTTSNLFLVESGGLVTPPATGEVLGGVTRDLVLRLARGAGIAIREERIPTVRLRRAREIFVTASTVEILPVVRLDGRRIASGRPGPVTRALQGAYRRAVATAVARARAARVAASR
jgi:branched-subunit amino acid aminotransferase/4-amino-4-deoxychorismate lyase